MSVRTGAGSDDEEEAGTSQARFNRVGYPALVEAVSEALLDAGDDEASIEVARRCGQLLEALHQQVLLVQSRRDAALVEVLQASPATSHYALARELGVSRQRIDQLSARVEAALSPRNADQGGSR